MVTRVVAGEAGVVVPAPGAARPKAAPLAGKPLPGEQQAGQQQGGTRRGGRAAEAGTWEEHAHHDAGEALADAAERAAADLRAARLAADDASRSSEQSEERPVGPPSLRVVPQPYDDVEDEAAADVS